MKLHHLLLIFLILGIIHMTSVAASSHSGEKHERHNIEEMKTERASDGVKQEAVTPPAVAHEIHEHPQNVETGSFNIIDKNKKSGHGAAVIFTIFVGIIWGVITFYWRGNKG
ncbi:MAG: hypothetical protein HZA00_08885 [Nitrospinae bacterium]|nr:hypothetical protein [Nitrospinota bacterium]